MEESRLIKRLVLGVWGICLAIMFAREFIPGISQAVCPYCQAGLCNQQAYIWDYPRGIFTSVASYLDSQSEIMWLHPSYQEPQMTSMEEGCSIARFETDYAPTAHYCIEHRMIEGMDGRFFIVIPYESYVVLLQPQEGRDIMVDNHRVTLAYDEEWNCWEMRFYW